jgi:hypothetical protein
MKTESVTEKLKLKIFEIPTPKNKKTLTLCLRETVELGMPKTTYFYFKLDKQQYAIWAEYVSKRVNVDQEIEVMVLYQLSSSGMDVKLVNFVQPESHPKPAKEHKKSVSSNPQNKREPVHA